MPKLRNLEPSKIRIIFFGGGFEAFSISVVEKQLIFFNRDKAMGGK